MMSLIKMKVDDHCGPAQADGILVIRDKTCR